MAFVYEMDETTAIWTAYRTYTYTDHAKNEKEEDLDEIKLASNLSFIGRATCNAQSSVRQLVKKKKRVEKRKVILNITVYQMMIKPVGGQFKFVITSNFP